MREREERAEIGRERERERRDEYICESKLMAELFHLCISYS